MAVLIVNSEKEFDSIILENNSISVDNIDVILVDQGKSTIIKKGPFKELK